MDISDKFLSLQTALIKLSNTEGYSRKCYDNRLKDLLKAGAKELSAPRVSIWSHSSDQQAICCQLLYTAASDTFENGHILSADLYPSYFEAIREQRLIVASDARTDPVTREFRHEYLEPLQIYSLLDVPIYSSGEHYGVLCIEYTQQCRQWDVAEMAYAIAMADRISLLNQHESWLREKEKIEHLGRTEVRTGLENRAYFQERVSRDLAASAGTPNNSALIIAELENFKSISTKWGLKPTIDMLSELAERLLKLPELRHCHIGRSAGDCFAFWLPRLTQDRSLEQIIQGINTAITEPITCHGQGNIKFTTCMGVSTLPVPGMDPNDPLRLSEIALSKAKKQGTNNAVHFNQHWYEESIQRNKMEESLIKAIKNDEIIPYYQPILDTLSGEVVGAEALMRWQHPTKGLLLPMDFFAVAQESGWMASLGDIMLHKVCRDLKISLEKYGPNALWLSINLGHEELHCNTLLENVRHLLRHHELPGHALEFEITEDLISHDAEIVLNQLNALDELGLKLSIDDFGTGYSSLSRIKHLPVTKLKIDKSFTDGLPLDDNDVCITNSIIGLAKGLNLSTVAEGVETRQQADWLTAHGCTYLQGNYFARPMPFADFLLLIAEKIRPGTRIDHG